VKGSSQQGADIEAKGRREAGGGREPETDQPLDGGLRFRLRDAHEFSPVHVRDVEEAAGFDLTDGGDG